MFLGLVAAAAVSAYEFTHGWNGDSMKLETMGQMPVGPGTDWEWDQIRGAVNRVAQVPATTKVFAAAVNYGLVYTDDIEAHTPEWHLVEGLSTAVAWVDIDPEDPSIVVVATGHVSSYSGVATDFRNGIFRSTDGGATFSRTGAQPFFFSNVASLWGGKAIGATTTTTSPNSNVTGFFMHRLTAQGGEVGEFDQLYEGHCFDFTASADYIFVLCASAILRFPSTLQTTDPAEWLEVIPIPLTSIPQNVRLSDFDYGRAGIEIQITPDHPPVLIAALNNDNGPGYFFSTEELAEPAQSFVAKCSFWEGFAKFPLSGVGDAPFHGQGSLHFGFAVDPVEPYTVIVGGSYLAGGLTASIARGDIRYASNYEYLYNNNHWGSLHPDCRQLAWYRSPSGGSPALFAATDNNIYLGVDIDTIPILQWLPKAGDMVSLEAHSGSYDLESGYFLGCFQDNGCATFLSPSEGIGGEMGDGGGGVLLRAQDGTVWSFISAQSLSGFMQYTVNPVARAPSHVFPPTSEPGFFVTFWVRSEGGVFAVATTPTMFYYLHEDASNSSAPYVLEERALNLNLCERSYLLKEEPDSFWVASANKVLRGSLANPNEPLVPFLIFEYDAAIEAFAVDPTSTSRFFVVNGIGQIVIWEDSNLEFLVCPALFGTDCAKINIALWVKLPNDVTAIVAGTDQGVFVYFPRLAGELANWCGYYQCQWAQLTYPGIGESFAQPVYTLQMERDTLVVVAMGTVMWKIEDAGAAIAALRQLRVADGGVAARRTMFDSNMITVSFTEEVSTKPTSTYLVYPDSADMSDYSQSYVTELDVTQSQLSTDGMELTINLTGVDSNRLFVLVTRVGDIVTAADPSIYLAFGQASALNEVDALTGTNMIILTSGYIASGATPAVPAAAPTGASITAGRLPGSLSVTWTPGLLNDCTFESYAITLEGEAGEAFQFNLNENSNLFEVDAYRGVVLQGLSYTLKYAVQIRTTCLSGDEFGVHKSTAPSDLSNFASPNSPPARVSWVKYDGRRSATMLGFQFRWKHDGSACVLDHWDFELDGKVVEGCTSNEIQEVPGTTPNTYYDCLAKDLDSSTVYRWARVRAVCTDPSLTSAWVTNDYSWGAQSEDALPMTLPFTCRECAADACVDGRCGCPQPSSSCCSPKTTCSDVAVANCVGKFDSYCVEVAFDSQCVTEAQDRCQLQC